jgi:hypothetical protein
MADSNSPAFVPPVNAVKDSDPMIIRVPLDKVDIGFRPSAAKSVDMTNNMSVSNLKNGQ